MRHYAYHSICLLFPQMTDEELRDLAEDIRIKGLLHDIVLYQGKILDGRNRFLACKIAGVKHMIAPLAKFIDWSVLQMAYAVLGRNTRPSQNGNWRKRSNF